MSSENGSHDEKRCFAVFWGRVRFFSDIYYLHRLRHQSSNRFQQTAGSLKAKTLFITGASRGIGLAIAKLAAADSANIVIAAKTTELNPKLPGTIYTAAAEIEVAGDRVLTDLPQLTN